MLKDIGKLVGKQASTPIGLNHKFGGAEEYTIYQVLHYLNGSPGKGILFKKSDRLLLQAYTNADYARSVIDKRSSTS